MADQLFMHSSAAENAARGMAVGSTEYASAVGRLRTGIDALGAVGSENSILGAELNEFTALLKETADASAQSFTSTGGAMSASVSTARGADEAGVPFSSNSQAAARPAETGATGGRA